MSMIMIGRTLSHYTVLTSIGHGGMGEVYQAEDLKLRRDVAIKVLPDEFAEDAGEKNQLLHLFDELRTLR